MKLKLAFSVQNYSYYKLKEWHRSERLVFVVLAHRPLSEHEGGFGFALVVGGRRAADDDGGSTVTAQRVLQDTGHLAVSVGDVGLQ